MICGGDGTEQAEEVAAAVWSLLCGRDFPLLRRYDARAGRLISYMAGGGSAGNSGRCGDRHGHRQSSRIPGGQAGMDHG